MYAFIRCLGRQAESRMTKVSPVAAAFNGRALTPPPANLQNKGGASSGGMPTTSDFKKFQRSYLIVYVCAVMADW